MNLIVPMLSFLSTFMFRNSPCSDYILLQLYNVKVNVHTMLESASLGGTSFFVSFLR